MLDKSSRLAYTIIMAWLIYLEATKVLQSHTHKLCLIPFNLKQPGHYMTQEQATPWHLPHPVHLQDSVLV